MKIAVVTEHFPHHNIKTSDENMINYINYDLVIKPVRRAPWFELTRRLRFKADTYLKQRAGMTGYELATAVTELKVFIRTLGRRFLVHFNVGDVNCKFFPFYKGRNMVMATYHQPPDFFCNFFKKCGHIERLDAAVVTSNVITDVISKYVNKDRIFYLPVSVDVDFFKPSEKLKDPDAKKICVCVGSWLRDFETMREIVKLFAGRGGVEFHIIAAEMNRRHFAGLPNARFFSGLPLAEYLEEIHNADLLVIPLKSCTSNLAVVEGMAVGLPIVASDVGGIRDYVKDSFAVLHKKGDHRAMADSIDGLLADPGKRKEMSARAREHSLNFSWEAASARLIKVYEGLGATVRR
ncbi:MAG: glycosyltransferase family 4 protein [Deltaproteobacteria bacterium]|nr:glycosyltransferase family 4 protein [Deltaproteobacteria bacterium]